MLDFDFREDIDQSTEAEAMKLTLKMEEMLFDAVRKAKIVGCWGGVTAPTLTSSQGAPRARAARACLGTPVLAWACTWAYKATWTCAQVLRRRQRLRTSSCRTRCAGPEVRLNGDTQNSVRPQQLFFLDLNAAQDLRRRLRNGALSSKKCGAGSVG